jgi:hypothetical protein
MPLLYLDMLGMKTRYVEGQVEGARRGYSKFRRLLGAGLAALPEGHQVTGGMQSDAASLQFATIDDALLVGRAICLAAFQSGGRARRTWVRGVILEHGWPTSVLAREFPLPNAPEGLYETRFSEHLLNAIPTCDGFRDVLWMVPEKIDEWPDWQVRMLDLLRWSARGGSAELEQAAATHLAFAEVEAILEGLRRRKSTA